MSIDIPVLRSVQNGGDFSFHVWEPGRPIVVMGRSGIEEKEAFTDTCREDGVPIYRRITGGGTVLLSPGMLVFSLARHITRPLAIKDYQRQVNGLLIRFLEGIGIRELSEKGISDICIGEKKILGSGMYIGKNTLFFQGSLLVNPNLSLIEMYIRHPRRQPDYRADRSHRDFITSLQEKGYDFKAGTLAPDLRKFLAKNIEKIS
jgi:lipoate---protein ligase